MAACDEAADETAERRRKLLLLRRIVEATESFLRGENHDRDFSCFSSLAASLAASSGSAAGGASALF